MSGLDRYRSMRDFTATSEPRGHKARRKAVRTKTQPGGIYVMQKHAARRLHYDLRLELDGVLKSWAVTRGPSLVPGEKRLAVETEDHPLEYATFEGEIPKGSYGAGHVIVWDRGSWSPTGDAAAQLKKGHLEFFLAGQKLGGRWHLVRMKGKAGEKKNNWLLIKGDDDAARDNGDDEITETAPRSVVSGKALLTNADRSRKADPKETKLTLSKAVLKHAKKSAPIDVPPALPKLVKTPPAGERWIHELKYDGYRILATVADGKVRLKSRNGLDWSHRFGRKLPAALKALGLTSAVIDGEMIVTNESSVSSFARLQEELSNGRSESFTYVMFDLLYVDGYDLRQVPFASRRALLEAAFGRVPAANLRLSEQFTGAASRVLSEVCRLGMEGIVSKTLASSYTPGRTTTWLKCKCHLSEDFFIAGYLPSSTSAKSIGALALAAKDRRGSLVYVGRVGTGFPERTAHDLWKTLQGLRILGADLPFGKNPDPQVTWVKPVLVAEISFTGWTRDRLLRHAVFKRLREDKLEIGTAPMGTSGQKRKSAAAASTRPLTHPDRIYWPDAGVSKQGLLDYYEQIWPLMREHVVDRPLALKRYPEGIGGEGFFQKNPWRGMPKAIKVTKGRDAGEQLLSISDFDGLAALVQSAALEIHVWGSTLRDVEKPDRIVFDLDPADGVAWDAVRDAAQLVRTYLSKLDLNPEVMVTGGKGIHVCARVNPDLDWTEAKDFTRRVAVDLVRAHPQRFTATMSLDKRKGKIFLDYLRNGRGSTAICPYSARARDGAPVAMPLSWAALQRTPSAAAYTIDGLVARPPTSSAWKRATRKSLLAVARRAGASR